MNILNIYYTRNIPILQFQNVNHSISLSKVFISYGQTQNILEYILAFT